MSAYYDLNGKKKTIDYDNKTEVCETSDAETTGYFDLKKHKWVPKSQKEEEGGGTIPGGDNDLLVKLIERSVVTANIPSGVTSLGFNSFSSCVSLTEVIIPEGVTFIDSRAFYGCDNLTSVVLPNSLTRISGSVFYNCYLLDNVVIPNSVVYLGDSVFSNCRSLKNITLSNNISTIPYSAFYGCQNLTSITIPASVVEIGNSAFYLCRNLTSITVEATTPPTISSGTFNGVPSNANIYVPAESVDVYKAASNWSSRAAYIQAIQE